MFQRPRNRNNRIVLNNIFRKLWEQHVMWTRSFIISAVDELGDLELVTERLLRNPVDFSDVLRVYYGNRKADEFQKLFEEHLLIAADLVNQAKRDDVKNIGITRMRWYRNATEIAAFLSAINPFWNRQKWHKMLDEHLKMTEDEVMTRLQKKYQKNIALFDDIEEQALEMADEMTKGMWRQFG